MKVDYVLILAAGKGTRMGELGKLIPKVLWPIFDKTLLELQLDYVDYLVPNTKIFINIYNYKDKLIDFISSHASFEKIQVLIESEMIDQGGAIHNLAEKVDYKGNLLILNGDQFLMCKSDDISNGLDALENADSLLYTYEVNSSDGYNALDIQDNYLKGIIKNSEIERNSVVPTYTGMSLIQLDKLTVQPGRSKFFETVANPTKFQIKTKLLKNFEYWDFGTYARYLDSINRVVDEKGSDFRKFLIEKGALNKDVSIYQQTGELKYSGFSIKDGKIKYQNTNYSDC